MAIDAGVYNNLQLPKLATLGEIADARARRTADQLELQNRQQLLQENQQKLAASAQQQRDAEAVKAIFAKHVGPDGVPDEKAILGEAYRVSPAIAATLRKSFEDDRKAAVDAQTSELNLHQKQSEAIAQKLQGVTPETYGQIRQDIAGIDPEAASFLPERYDPNDPTSTQAVQAVMNGALSRQEYSAEQTKIINSKKDLETQAKLMIRLAHDQDTYDEAVAFAKKMQVWKDLADQGFGEQFTPEVGAKATALLPLNERQAIVSQQDKAADNARMEAASAEAARHNRAMENRPVGGSTADTAGDAKDIAAAIISGDQPPSLTGMYRFAAPIRAELARQGYDLTKATEDWNATSKYLQTLNGAQQTRLRQAITFADDSLSIIDELNGKWKGGRFPLLNKANLAAAKAGVYGQDVQSVANQLDAQISDLVSELGTVYKGGNSSTDESLKLAANNLQSDWSEKTLRDAMNLVRRNLRIRQNSIRNTGVGGGTSGQYAPSALSGQPMTAEELIKKYGGQ